MGTKVIVGVDGSVHSRRALEWCAAHAAALDAEIVVVHAIDAPVIVSPMSAAFPLPEFTPEDRKEIERIVTEDWCTPLKDRSVPFRVVLRDGEPAPGLIQVAKTEKADLVVTGRRGRGG